MRSAFYVLFTAWGLLLSLVSAMPAEARITVGDSLPPVKLLNWNGQPVDLADLRGRVVVIDFWASWCAACREALPALDTMHRRYAERGLSVVGIDVDRNRAVAARFLAERLPAPAVTLLRDPDANVLADFGAEGMPALYVIDGAGVVRFTEVGYTPDRLPAIEAAIRQLLGGT